MARHEILGGKVQLYKRPDGRFWQCSATVGCLQHRASTKKDELSQAEDAAEEWFLELRGKYKRGELNELVPVKRLMTFAAVAEVFLREFPVLTEGQRNAQYVQGHERRVRQHLIPFMGNKLVTEVTSGLVQDYRVHRVEKSKAKWGRPPARNTIHQEIVVLRQILKTAQRHGWITGLPDLSQPYKTNGKISHRAWFSPEEYRRLYTLTNSWAKNPPTPRFSWEYAQLHDFILFMANTGLRPDEAARLEYRDVSVVDDDRSGETILEIECRGKRGYGPCKSTANAVRVFRRLQKRNQPQPTDRIFPVLQKRMFRTALKELSLKFDREGQPRTFYSLRHTYISFRLLEGANIVQLAWNCRTSIDMIEKYYASHIKTRIDASAINVGHWKVKKGRRLQKRQSANDNRRKASQKAA